MPQGFPSRVVIADDDPVFRSLAESCLIEAGYDVTLAQDGADALEILSAAQPQLAIVDLDMPRIDGLRLIGLLRGMPTFNRMSILVISTSQSSTMYDEARRLGADAVLTKPVDWSLLPGTICQVLQRKRRSASGMLAAGTICRLH